MRKMIDLIDKKFGFLTVIKREIITRKNKVRTYWICECICKRIHKVEHGVLKRGNVKSCGCKTRELISNAVKKGGNRANFVVAYHNVKNAGLNRGLVWEIPEKLFQIISQKNCFYCDAVPNNISNTRDTCEPFTYNGLDRVDNTIGYTIGNVVTCCKYCNAGKNDGTQQEFLARVKRINIRHNL